MKPIRGRITEAVFKTAHYVPFIFPKWLREQSKDFMEFGNSPRSHCSKNEDKIEYASFLEGSFIWKGISVTIQLDNEEVEALNRWIKKNASKLRHTGCSDICFNTKYDQRAVTKFCGGIDINIQKSKDSLMCIQTSGNSCSCCYITVDQLKRGFYYLTLYFGLTEKATNKILNVETDSIFRYRSFQSFNPLSDNFKIIRRYYRRPAIRKMLANNFNIVVSECKKATFSILKKWNIKRKENDLITVADFYRNHHEQYFQRSSKYKRTHFALIRRAWENYDQIISEDKTESYCLKPGTVALNVDAFYILSKLEDESAIYRPSLRISLGPSDSHIVFSLVLDCYRQLNEIVDYTTPCLLKNKNKPEKNNTMLYHALLRIDRLEDNINSIEDYAKFECKEKYQKAISSHIDQLIRKTTDFKDAVVQRKKYCRDSLELRNKYFHKKYAYIVGFLVLLQILLAGLTIDWNHKVTELKAYFDFISDESKQ